MCVFLLMSAALKTSKLGKICDPEQRRSFNDLKDLDECGFLSVNAVKDVENNFYWVLASKEVLWSNSNLYLDMNGTGRLESVFGIPCSAMSFLKMRAVGTPIGLTDRNRLNLNIHL